jgi:hypothetical protein
MLVAIIIRCWLCYDPNCELTKAKLKELKKKVWRCCPCCENDEEFIDSINNNIIIDNNDLVPGNGLPIYAREGNQRNDNEVEIDNPDNDRLVSLGLIEAISKYPAQDSSLSHIYFPLVLSTKKPSLSFVNITQPVKPLTFIPVCHLKIRI